MLGEPCKRNSIYSFSKKALGEEEEKEENIIWQIITDNGSFNIKGYFQNNFVTNGNCMKQTGLPKNHLK